MKRSLAALLILFAALPGAAREGFGFKKKAVEMTRTIPPSTNAGARRVAVEVSSDRGDTADDAKTLERYISDAILAGAGTLAESGKPEVTLDVTLDRLESHETWKNETEYVSQQTGTKQVWNESKKKYESKPIYSNVPVQKSYKVISASLAGTYEITARGDDVASGDLDEKFSKKYGEYETPPAPTQVEDDLLQDAAREIVAHLVPTQDRVSVLLPRATLEPLIPLAEAGSWDRYLAAVEKVPPMRNAKDEAYRQYALAVGKEALAYTTADRAEALDLLRSASSHYETAMTSNPGEELFRKGYVSLLSSGSIGVPTARIAESVKKYEAWTGSAPPPAPVRTASASSAAAKQGMRNQTIIDLARAGLSDENIILAIDGAERTEFDVSSDGLISLSKAGVSKSVIAHMQKKRK